MKKLTPVSELNLLLVLTMTAACRDGHHPLTFPIGDWGNSEKVDEMLCRFQRRAPRHR
ncbi:MAG: hypothetical protein ACLS7Z_04795 [Christensenellales bacterium]